MSARITITIADEQGYVIDQYSIAPTERQREHLQTAQQLSAAVIELIGNKFETVEA